MKTMQRAKREIVFYYKDVAELSSQYATWVRLHPRALNILRHHMAGDPQSAPVRHKCTISYEEDEMMGVGDNPRTEMREGKGVESGAVSG